MNIAFFSEGQYQGKVSRTDPNLRTDLAWICALNADHWSLNQAPNPGMPYDLGIVIIPKHNPNFNMENYWLDEIEISDTGQSGYELHGEVRLIGVE